MSWAAVQTSYIGVALRAGDTLHFGWARLCFLCVPLLLLSISFQQSFCLLMAAPIHVYVFSQSIYAIRVCVASWALDPRTNTLFEGHVSPGFNLKQNVSCVAKGYVYGFLCVHLSVGRHFR